MIDVCSFCSCRTVAIQLPFSCHSVATQLPFEKTVVFIQLIKGVEISILSILECCQNYSKNKWQLGGN
jgi:hypothetical protein